MRRGDIRTALLAVLAEGPGHGYDVMQRLEDKSGGVWRPSPGSVYPTLQMLEDEGLVRSTERDGKRIFEITDEGRAESERRLGEAGDAPWASAGRARGEAGEVRHAVGQLMHALKQVYAVGSPAQVERATAIVLPALRDTRRQLYEILSEE
jgi:DNA-binding PadR family transcriptional regulator